MTLMSLIEQVADKEEYRVGCLGCPVWLVASTYDTHLQEQQEEGSRKLQASQFDLGDRETYGAD